MKPRTVQLWRHYLRKSDLRYPPERPSNYPSSTSDQNRTFPVNQFGTPRSRPRSTLWRALVSAASHFFVSSAVFSTPKMS